MTNVQPLNVVIKGFVQTKKALVILKKNAQR